jgi:hypothetical protein
MKLKEIEFCSIDCKVADTRNILAITRSLKPSDTPNPNTPHSLISIYLDIIENIQVMILERLKNNRFEEPYFITRITEFFIQEIADDIQNQSKSHFLDKIAKFQSKNSMSGEKKSSKLGLLALFDFLINYMSDMEDRARATAMARCGQCHLNQNDKTLIISSLVLAIYPYCKTINFPKNLAGNIIGKMVDGVIKIGIKYLCTSHVNRSISICQTLTVGNPCEVVIP